MKVPEIICDRILEMLGEGSIPWDKPFSSISPRNLRGTGYRGINLLILSISMELESFKSPYFLTFNQCRALGGRIKKGSKGIPIVFWKWIDRKDSDKESGEFNSADTSDRAEPRKIPFLRYYTVFNLNQTEGIPADKIPAIESRPESWEPFGEIDKFIGDFPGLNIRYSGSARAYYQPTDDFIHCPDPDCFATPESYYSTCFHEIGHWTGHKSRLNRDLSPLNSEHEYAFEELVAELYSAFVCGYFGIEKSTIRNSAGYIQNWLKALKSDPAMIIKAAGKAQKALDYSLEITGRIATGIDSQDSQDSAESTLSTIAA